MDDKLNFKLLNLLILIAIICLLYLIRGLWLGLVGTVFSVIAPFLLAFGVAYMVCPLVRKLLKMGCAKWVAILITCVLSLGIVILLAITTIPLLYEQILLFISNISVFLSDLSVKYEINLGDLQSTLTDFSTSIMNNIGSKISNGAITLVNTSVSVISSSIVVFGAAVYFLIDMDKIRNGIKNFYYKRNRRLVFYLKELDSEMSKYIMGMGLNIILQMIEYTIAFLIIGHPNYLILGILSGVSAIIPWFGGFLVAVLSLLVSSVISTKMFILTVIICIICPTLDGNVIGPKVYGKTNAIHPLLVIFSVSAGGMIAGFWGIVLSLPIAIAIKTTYNFYKKDIHKGMKNIKKKTGTK